MKYLPWPRAHKTNQNKTGFTLFEMTVVLALIATIATLCLPTINFFKRNTGHLAVETLRMTIMMLHQRALTTGKQCTLVFDQCNHTYSYNSDVVKLPATLRFGVQPGVLGPPSAPKSPIKKSITLPAHRVRFGPGGIIDAGTIYMVDSSINVMYAITIPVTHDPYVRAYRYTKQWKML